MCLSAISGIILELLLQRAWEYWNVKSNEKNAIFYQTISFCLQSRCAYQDNDEVFAYIEKLHKEINYHGPDKPLYSFCTFDDISKYLDREIVYTCRKFPKEWTVVQICKNFNPIAMSSRFDDIVNFNTGISMTIFTHAAISEMLMLEIKNLAFTNENIFEKVYALNRKITTEMNFHTMPQANEKEKAASLEQYHRSVKEIELYVKDVMEKLKQFIGPWITALSGVFKSRKSQEIQNEIRKRVDEFLKKKGSFGESQQKLVHILARRVDLLSNEQIFLAITYVLREKPNLGYSDIDLNDLYDFLLWVKQEYVYDDVQTHPVILIVDEVLDQFPFETINLNQEFTRVCSFANLKKLHDRYCGQIENGYLNIQANRCQAIINPDGSLQKMEQRMRSFFSYWLPTWHVKYNQRPTNQEFYDILIKTDVLMYSGHGTGLQLMTQDNVYNLKSKAVVFLFGCSSVALSSVGLHSELKGAHTYYHIGGSPVVIGFLWTITDFNTDLCSTKILSAWFNSTSPQPRQHFQTIDAKLWRSHGTMREFDDIF